MIFALVKLDTIIAIIERDLKGDDVLSLSFKIDEALLIPKIWKFINTP